MGGHPLFQKAGKITFLILWLLASFLSYQQVQQHQGAWPKIQWPQIYPSVNSQPFYHEQLIPNANQNSTHSVSTATLPSGELIAFWFAGSREGASDVQIFQSYFNQKSHAWSEPKGILNTKRLGGDLDRYIGKIGNPLVYLDARQRTWLYFVTVSYGGWAGSNLNVMHSDDLGQSWSTPKRLITSPFINVSTLVRNAMVGLEDGSMLIPVYHEFAVLFPELLRISADGEVMSKTRMHGNGGGIQPSLIEGESGEVVALMRAGSHNVERKVLRLTSFDNGQSWSPLELTSLPNPNAAQIAVKVADKLWIWIGNHNPEHRQDLTLAVSDNPAGDWQVVHKFEDGKQGEAFSYPDITQGKDGIWHLMYTFKRKNIKHVQFNEAWLRDVMRQSGVSLP